MSGMLSTLPTPTSIGLLVEFHSLVRFSFSVKLGPNSQDTLFSTSILGIAGSSGLAIA